MTGMVEFADDAAQYAAQNRPTTAAEAAEIARLSGPQAAKQYSVEVERLARLHDEKSVNLPTSTGARTSNDDPRIQRARKRIRDGA